MLSITGALNDGIGAFTHCFALVVELPNQNYVTNFAASLHVHHYLKHPKRKKKKTNKSSTLRPTLKLRTTPYPEVLRTQHPPITTHVWCRLLKLAVIELFVHNRIPGGHVEA